jgi:hypothetical protein
MRKRIYLATTIVDIDSEHEEDSEHKQSFSTNSDIDFEYKSDDEMC